MVGSRVAGPVGSVLLLGMICLAGCSSKKSTLCDPPCPEGYDCVDGECVEPCDPPCGPGYTCNVDTGECEPVEDATTEPDMDAPADVVDAVEEDDPVADPVEEDIVPDPGEDGVEDPEEDVPADVPADVPCTGPSVLMTDTRVGTGVDAGDFYAMYAFVTAHWTGSEFGVTWEDATMTLRLTRVSAGGSVLGTVSSITDAPGASRVPASAWSGSNYGVTWLNGGVYFRLLGPDGAKIGSDVHLSAGESLGGAMMLDIAWSGSEYGIVFDASTSTGSYYGLFFFRVSSSGSKVGMATEASPMTDLNDHQFDLAWSGSEYGMAWGQPDMTSGSKEFLFDTISPTGVRDGSVVMLSTTWPDGYPPSTVWSGSEYGVAWSQGNDVYFTRVAGDGTRIGTSTRITTATGASITPDLIWIGSEYALAWSDERGTTSEIYAAFLSGDGVKTTSDIRVSTGTGASEDPSLAWTGSAIGVFWKDGRAGYTDRYDLYHNQIGICP